MGPEIEPFSEPVADYRWRAYVARADWVRAVAELAAEIDYDHFKYAVTDRQGGERAHLYIEVWQAMLKRQERNED